MTTLTALLSENETVIEVNANGCIKALALHLFYALSADQDLHETAALAIANPGTPVPIQGTSRTSRPRHSRVYGLQQ